MNIYPILALIFFISILLILFLPLFLFVKVPLLNPESRGIKIFYCVWFVSYGIFILFFTGPIDLSEYPSRDDALYSLPWKSGVERFVVQGNRSFTSHRDFHLYAWDFSMPNGTEVLAARDGVVVEIKDQFKGVGLDSNNIYIEHADGQKSGYAHIAFDSSRVFVGSKVKRGTVIALSGMVGQTILPHLHFTVVGKDGKSSVPISFKEIVGGIPYAGQSYISKNKKITDVDTFRSKTPSSCGIEWEELGVKTPFHSEKVRPQGLTQFSDKVILSNHYKDSMRGRPSDLLILNSESLSVESRFLFPDSFKHVGGLSAGREFIYASDFDYDSILKINLSQTLKTGRLVASELPKISLAGASGMALLKDTIALSSYILPYRSPYLSRRRIRFFSLKSGDEIEFSGDLRDSNYSQGLVFVKAGEKTYLIESINRFSSVLRYWVTDTDDKADLIRIYRVDLNTRKIEHVSDSVAPSSMVEDLSWDGKDSILLTDEQSFNFYKGVLRNCK